MCSRLLRTRFFIASITVCSSAFWASPNEAIRAVAVWLISATSAKPHDCFGTQVSRKLDNFTTRLGSRAICGTA